MADNAAAALIALCSSHSLESQKESLRVGVNVGVKPANAAAIASQVYSEGSGAKSELFRAH
jgi:hypothetical protein